MKSPDRDPVIFQTIFWGSLTFLFLNLAFGWEMPWPAIIFALGVAALGAIGAGDSEHMPD